MKSTLEKTNFATYSCSNLSRNWTIMNCYTGCNLILKSKQITDQCLLFSLVFWSYQKVKCIMRRYNKILKINIIQSISLYKSTRKLLSVYWFGVMMFRSCLWTNDYSHASFWSLSLIFHPFRRVWLSTRRSIDLTSIMYDSLTHSPIIQNQFQKVSFENVELKRW